MIGQAANTLIPLSADVISQGSPEHKTTVRAAHVGDLSTIAAFNCQLAREIDEARLDPTPLAAAVAAQLDDPTLGRYWLAFQDGIAIGQLRLWQEWYDWGNGLLWWLDNVYVRPRYRRRGVTRVLFDHVFALASADPRVLGFRLHVAKANAIAQQSYEALGFSVTNDVMELRLAGTGA